MAKPKKVKKEKAAKKKPPKEKPKDKDKDKSKDKSQLKITSYVPVKINCPYCKRTMMTKVVYNKKRSAIGLAIMRTCAG